MFSKGDPAVYGKPPLEYLIPSEILCEVIKIFELKHLCWLPVKALRSLLRKSRRRLITGAVIIILGAVYLAYVSPKFVEASRNVWNSDSKKDISLEWPPELREQMKREIDKVHEDFYVWTILFVLGCLVVIAGLRSFLKPRQKPKPRRRPGR